MGYHDVIGMFASKRDAAGKITDAVKEITDALDEERHELGEPARRALQRIQSSAISLVVDVGEFLSVLKEDTETSEK